MMKLRHLFISMSVLFIATDLKAQQKNETELLAVVENFKISIKNKQIDHFRTLLLNDAIPWIGISDSASYIQSKQKFPAANPMQIGSPLGFINFVAAYGGKIEEKIEHIQIQHDEVLATIIFDYSYFKDNHLHNWGKETWTLLRINGAWKIAAVYYSITLATVKPAPDFLRE